MRPPVRQQPAMSAYASPLQQAARWSIFAEQIIQYMERSLSNPLVTLWTWRR